MQYRKLGTTDIDVSVIAMGCWAITGDACWGNQEERDALAAIRTAADEGINFFDTAEGYSDGYSEQLLSKALGDRINDVVIASKVSPTNLRPDDLGTACDNSLRRLGKDCLDLYQIHWPSADIPIADSWAALERLRDAGKIRHIGVSNFGPRNLAELLAVGRPAVNQVAYNMLFRAIEFEIQPVCEQNGIAILPYCPIAQGLLTGKFSSADDVPDGRARTRHFSSRRSRAIHGEPGQETETFAAIDAVRRISGTIGEPMAHVAMAWLISRPAVASILVGARSAEQVHQNIGAAELALPVDVIDQLDNATERLKQALGPNADQWAPKSRMT